MKIKNIFLVALLIALAISLGFNYLLYSQVQTLNNKYDNNFAMVLKIDVYHNGVWKNALYKTGDLLKYNFGNLTQLWFMSRSSSDSLTSKVITLAVFSLWQYNYNDFVQGTGVWTQQSSCVTYQFSANDLATTPIYLWAYIPPTAKVGQNVYNVPFNIAFGNSTAPFGTPFPKLAHNTATLNFGYKGNQCGEAAHEGVNWGSGLVATQNTQSSTNRIFLNYTGYWTNSYSVSYSIVYTRLYLPLIQYRTISGTNYVWVYWLLVAEDSFTAVTLNSGDIVRITYSLQINP